ncbi:unnamed protein product, partial [Polarella glacialis]
ALWTRERPISPCALGPNLRVSSPEALGGGASLWRLEISPKALGSSTSRARGTFQGDRRRTDALLVVVNPTSGMLDAFELPDCDGEHVCSERRSCSAPPGLGF